MCLVLSYWFPFSIYLYTFINGLLSSSWANLEAYVTSSFSGHRLMAAVSMLRTIFGGVSTLVIAKIIDVWGRIWGLGIAIVFLEIGGWEELGAF